MVDLTHTMSPDFPTFLGAPGIRMEKEFDFKKDGFNLYWWRLNEHAGTHMDAPIHFSENGASAERFRLHPGRPARGGERGGQGCAERDYLLTREDLAAWEKEVPAAAG